VYPGVNEYPAKLGGRSARAPPSAEAGWPRLPPPAKSNGIPKLQSPAKKAPRGGGGGGSRAACARRHTARREWQRSAGGVLDYGMATTLLGRALGVHQAAVVSARGCLPQKSPCTRHCVEVFCGVAAVGLCRATTSDGVRRGGAPGRQRRSPAPAKAKRAGRSIGRLLAGEL
jgi:hypothetical protein